MPDQPATLAAAIAPTDQTPPHLSACEPWLPPAALRSALETLFPRVGEPLLLSVHADTGGALVAVPEDVDADAWTSLGLVGTLGWLAAGLARTPWTTAPLRGSASWIPATSAAPPAGPPTATAVCTNSRPTTPATFGSNTSSPPARRDAPFRYHKPPARWPRSPSPRAATTRQPRIRPFAPRC